MDFSDDEDLGEVIKELNLDMEDEIVVDEYKEDNKDEIIKPLINTCQVSSLHNRTLIRTKISNYEEMILSFDFYLDMFGLFTQPESIEMKQVFFGIIETIEYKHYSILIPIFFIYAYCLSKQIAFPKSLKKRIAIEVYTKKTCNELMVAMVSKFLDILNVPKLVNYSWEFYIRGFMLMVRSTICGIGMNSGVDTITANDELFLQNKDDNNSLLKDITYKVKVESYRILAIGMIKNNCYNSSEFERIFDLHIKTLLSVLKKKEIINERILHELSEKFSDCPPNSKLLTQYTLEEEIYNSSKIIEIPVMCKYQY